MSAIASSAGSNLRFASKFARKDPELYVLGVVMLGALTTAGYYFGRNPPAAVRMGEEAINIAKGTAPWAQEGVENSDRDNYKYMYHPGGDFRNPPKKAPSALNSVLVPGVTLPKRLHEKFNKWGKDNY